MKNFPLDLTQTNVSVALRNGAHCRAIKTRATIRSIAFLIAKARPFDRVDFIRGGRALDRGQRMLELWNNWYETLASAEALAAVIVIVVVAAGVITLAERSAAINASDKRLFGETSANWSFRPA